MNYFEDEQQAQQEYLEYMGCETHEELPTLGDSEKSFAEKAGDTFVTNPDFKWDWLVVINGREQDCIVGMKASDAFIMQEELKKEYGPDTYLVPA